MSTIGERIKNRRIQLKLSQKKLALLCGWKYQSRITAYERGELLPPLKQLSVLEGALKLPPGSLTLNLILKPGQPIESNINNVNMETTARFITVTKIPLLSYEEFYMQKKGNLYLQKNAESIMIEENLQSFCAIKVVGDSMTSITPNTRSFSEGDVVLVDQNKEPAIGNYVFACIDEKDIVFKQYVQDAGKKYLKSINPAYSLIPVNENVEIIGVASIKYNLDSI